MTSSSVGAPTVERRTSLIEPGGIERIPLAARHGSPWQLFATWTSPNLEFATVFIGVLGMSYFGLSFAQTVLACVVGNLLGAASQGILSTWGPRDGLAQMVLSRTAFGHVGNVLPAALMTVMAGIGWFAVNSVSGAFALATLTHWPVLLCLFGIVVVEVLVAFVGHDLVQGFERYAAIVLGAVFLVASVTVLVQLHPDAAPASGGLGGIGGMLLMAGSAFGYTAGWNPYAADYSRYLHPDTSPVMVGLAAGLGNFVSTTVLMTVGAASMTLGTAANNGTPTDAFTEHMPGPVAALTLLAIAVGAISANVLNIYSGAMSFLAMGVKIPFALRRAIVALGFGVVGFFVAWSALADAGEKYENFILIIAYWIAPWLGIVLVDRWLRRGTATADLAAGPGRYRNPAGVVALVVGMVVSIALFSNQADYLGLVPRVAPAVGDLTPLVGFLLAGAVYLAVFRLVKPRLGDPLPEPGSDREVRA